VKHAFLVAAVFLLVFSGLPALACQNCTTYFNYETETWCKTCDTEANCGWFNCWVFQPLPGSDDYCTGDDFGCFTYRRHCASEPQAEMPKRLDESWRLGRVHVYRTPGNGTPSPDAPPLPKRG
jgi:hypothetical protein